MMNPVLLSFADGTMFFVGLVFVSLSVFGLLFVKRRLVRFLLTVCALGGIVLVVGSAAPLPMWMYVVWLIAVLASVCFLHGFESYQKVKPWMCVILCLASIGMAAVELPYRWVPKLKLSPGTTIYVLGDSISAGIRNEDRTWPEVLEDLSGYRVVNCARAGATVDAAHRQALEITEPNAFVMIENRGERLARHDDG